MNILGNNIRNLRLAWGMTQKELGTELDVSSTTVTQWEKGRNLPTVTMLMKIIDYFKTTPAQLLGYEEIPTNSTLSPAQEELLASMVGMDAAGYAYIQGVIYEYKSKKGL